jgi:ribosomal-protein-alanine N-acetyltransferase
LIDPADAPALAGHLARDAAAFARYEPPRTPSFFTAEGQRERIAALLSSQRAGDAWPGVVLADAAVIGQITVQSIVRSAFRKASIGYWIATTHQGSGHATRAVGLALEYMSSVLGLHRAEASTQLDNLASQHVLRANGFTPFGVAHAEFYALGAWHDQIRWERLL